MIVDATFSFLDSSPFFLLGVSKRKGCLSSEKSLIAAQLRSFFLLLPGTERKRDSSLSLREHF